MDTTGNMDTTANVEAVLESHRHRVFSLAVGVLHEHIVCRMCENGCDNCAFAHECLDALGINSHALLEQMQAAGEHAVLPLYAEAVRQHRVGDWREQERMHVVHQTT